MMSWLMCAGLAIEVTARLGWQAPPLNSLMPGRIYAQVSGILVFRLQ